MKKSGRAIERAVILTVEDAKKVASVTGKMASGYKVGVGLWQAAGPLVEKVVNALDVKLAPQTLELVKANTVHSLTPYESHYTGRILSISHGIQPPGKISRALGVKQSMQKYADRIEDEIKMYVRDAKFERHE